MLATPLSDCLCWLSKLSIRWRNMRLLLLVHENCLIRSVWTCSWLLSRGRPSQMRGSNFERCFELNWKIMREMARCRHALMLITDTNDFDQYWIGFLMFFTRQTNQFVAEIAINVARLCLLTETNFNRTGVFRIECGNCAARAQSDRGFLSQINLYFYRPAAK